MQPKRRTGKKLSRRVTKTKRKSGALKPLASDAVSGRDLIRAAMKQRKRILSSAGRFLRERASTDGNGIGAAAGSVRPATFRQPRSELEAAIQRYVDLYDFAPIAYVSFDRVGRIKEINLAATQLLGSTRDLLMGSPFAVHVVREDSRLFLNHLVSCRSSGNRVETELRLKRRGGETIPTYLSSVSMTSSMRNGALLYPTAIIDLRERKQAEKELRESEERFRAIVSQTTVGLARSDLKGNFIFVNQKFCEMLGYEEAELKGKAIQEITYRDDIAESMRLFRKIVDKGRPYQLEKRYIRKDGSIFWASVSASPMCDSAGKPESAVAVILDVSARKEAEAALQESRILLETRVRERTSELLAANEELENEIALRKKLEGEVLEVSDREQRRLGQDLHDSLCQHLAATAFMTRALAERVKSAKTIEPAEIEKIAHLINEGVTEARVVARGLHPVEMDSAGLPDALRSLCKLLQNGSCRAEIDDELPFIDHTVATHLYRIAREAVINANKHARAREIIVRVHTSRKQLELSVTDDGVGISDSSRSSAGLGMHIMNYRARTIGARLEVKRLKPRGTRVTCYLPRK